jgi:uncharacterized protein YndB with AHSA1/START domain
MKWAMAVGMIAALTGLAGGEPGDRVLRTELTVDAPIDDVWRAWTTEEGVRTFFAPAGRIEPRVDGAYDIYFFPERPAGQRGAEGMRILAFEPPRRLVFTWNAPPDIPAVRAQRTTVEIALEPAGPARTKLRFTHAGWGEGPDWDKAYGYFDQAWNAVVLPRLVHRFARGPVDWARRPDLRPVTDTLRVALEPVSARAAGH